MAGNKNAWRDIFTSAEWLVIKAQATQAGRRNVGLGGHRPPVGWTVATVTGTLSTAPAVLQAIENEITLYNQIAKDDCAKFANRIAKLQYINTLCKKYLELLGTTHRLGIKTVGGKQLTDQVDVWVRSLGKRALKKAGYLQSMEAWHKTAKAKYKDKDALSLYLRELAADNTRDGGTKLHATPYATIEKIDPFHRQTFVFLDPDDLGNDESVNEMGEAFVDYLTGRAASNPDRATNPNASFYEWLEYHPFCVGTPGVLGDAKYKDPNRISYENLDLAHVYMPDGRMEYERILSDPGNRRPLTTSAFRASGKGPPGAAAFVWDSDCHLWAHEHGWDGFIHASAKQGRKIRCSGMLVADKGLATWITNQSGHYAPNAQSMYHFVSWLHSRHCLHNDAKVKMDHDKDLADGDYKVPAFLGWGRTKFGPPVALPYFV